MLRDIIIGFAGIERLVGGRDRGFLAGDQSLIKMVGRLNLLPCLKPMTYCFYTDQTKRTSQSEPIPGRESEMIQGKSGGYVFEAGIWQTVRRCLILGTAGDQFYNSKMRLTGQFVEVLNQAIEENPQKVADEILYASDSHAANNHAPIFALVLLSMGVNPEAKAAFRQLFPSVVRTGSHFHEWLSYTKQLRGMGRVVREVGREWLTRDDVAGLAHQMLKYQQRYGFSFRDGLRLFKPVPPTENHKNLFAWASGKSSIEASAPTEVAAALSQIYWYEWLKCHPEGGVDAVKKGRLTHEMVAPIAKMDRDVWQALFEQMPIGALLRNLGSLTEIGVIRFDATANLDLIDGKLANPECLRKGRIHPIDILKALKTYQSGGSLGRSKKTWEPVDRVVAILETALNLSFETLEATGKAFLHAIDVSGSMSWLAARSVGLTASEIAATMALCSAKVEKNYVIRGFNVEFVDLGISGKDSYATACGKVKPLTFGGTDASVAIDWALENRIKIDVFCFWTDHESWAGRRHPSQALKEYRQKINPNVKAVYTAITADRVSLVDPKDPLSFDFAGFDPSIPKAIQEIAAF